MEFISLMLKILVNKINKIILEKENYSKSELNLNFIYVCLIEIMRVYYLMFFKINSYF